LKPWPKCRQRIQGIVCFFAIFHMYLSILQYVRLMAQTRKASIPKIHLTTWSDAWWPRMIHSIHQETHDRLLKYNTQGHYIWRDSPYAPLKIYHLRAYSRNESMPAPTELTCGYVQSWDHEFGVRLCELKTHEPQSMRWPYFPIARYPNDDSRGQRTLCEQLSRI
jgi:hypothetical protein